MALCIRHRTRSLMRLLDTMSTRIADSQLTSKTRLTSIAAAFIQQALLQHRMMQHLTLLLLLLTIFRTQGFQIHQTALLLVILKPSPHSVTIGVARSPPFVTVTLCLTFAMAWYQ